MKILVAIDGSPRASAALASLIDRLSWFRDVAELGLVFTHLPLPYKRAVAWAGKDAVQRYYDEETEEAVAPARRVLESRGIPHSVETRIGDPAHEIVDYANAGGFDLIVMGTHGHTALANIVLGSTATKVLAMSKVPVLLL